MVYFTSIPRILVHSFFICFLALMLLPAIPAHGEDAPQKVIDIANAQLAELGKNPVIIAAVKAANAEGKTLDQIKDMDAKWKNTPGIAGYMRTMMESDCAKFLRDIQDKGGYFSEIFVMDNQGANVAMTDKTSDYWQGDEAKFQKAFNAGAGAVFVDKVEFDDSSQAYLVQVSVPVVENGVVIGTVTFGINVDELEE